MQCVIHCRIRTIFFFSLSLFLLLSSYVIWPWCYAAWIWRKSTIDLMESVDFPVISTLNNTGKKVPAIIHQTWRDANTIPLSWQQASNSCRSLHPNYEYRLWTDKDARNLIEKEFPCLLTTFDSYPYDIQRADVIRLIILYIYGGIYLDLDIICLKSLDELRSNNFVLPRTMPVGLSNDFIIAQPKHPFLLQVLNDLPRFNQNFFTKYLTVMFSTGPMFITQEASFYQNRSAIKVLSQELYGKYVYNSSRSLFRHLKASSWHGNDAAFIKWIYRRRTTFLLLTITFCVMTFALIYLIHHHLTIVNLVKRICSKIKLKFRRQSFKYDKIHSNII